MGLFGDFRTDQDILYHNIRSVARKTCRQLIERERESSLSKYLPFFIHVFYLNSFDRRLYGTVLLILCSLIVWVGVKFVSKVAPIALVVCVLSILSIYFGIFINYEGTPDT